MRSRAILLRLLLCLVLVANGTTAAFANARMAMTMGDAAPATQQDAAPPCHDMQADDGAAMDHDAPSTSDSHEDCCGSACLCDCVAHATAFLAIDALALTAQPAAPPVSAPQESRASPALPHPIRPPIG